MQQNLKDLSADVVLRWTAPKVSTLVRLVNGGEKIEVKPGEKVTCSFEKAKELMKYSPFWEFVSGTSQEVELEDPATKKEAKKEAKKGAKKGAKNAPENSNDEENDESEQEGAENVDDEELKQESK